MIKSKYKIKKNKLGFYQISPTPSPEEITKFYADEFYTGEYKNFNDSSLEVQVQDKDFFEGKWLDIYENFLEIKKKINKNTSILDIGCGWSQALIFFKKKGLECYGFDPAIEAVQYGCKKGLNIKHAGLDGMDVFEGKKFDIVTMFNVLEHLADPVKALKQIKKILKPKGILVVDVPNEFNDFQLAGRDTHNLKNWWIAPPNHLNYFSKDSLVKLLESLSFSVKICESSFPLEMFLLFGDNYVTNRKLGSESHKKRVAFEMNLRKFNKKLTLKNFYRALANINLGRQITIYSILK
jgi:2-polyprenyl-3-methyl-5-hydroxy-6-metoxy-1,4-benzoquinol methylase